MSFWSELKRRQVVKVGVAYALVAGAVGGAADIFLPGDGDSSNFATFRRTFSDHFPVSFKIKIENSDDDVDFD